MKQATIYSELPDLADTDIDERWNWCKKLDFYTFLVSNKSLSIFLQRARNKKFFEIFKLHYLSNQVHMHLRAERSMA